MLKELVDFFIAFLELMEAEAQSARRGVAVLGLALMLGFAASLVLLGALGLLTWALYLVLAPEMSQAGALSLCALALIIIGGLSLCFARKILR